MNDVFIIAAIAMLIATIPCGIVVLTSETEQGKARTPLTMIVPAAVLVVGALGVVFAPHLGTAVEAGAVRFEDQAAYSATVLSGAHVAHPAAVAPAEPAGVTATALATGVGSALGGLPSPSSRCTGGGCPCWPGFEPGVGLTRSLQRLQSGVINDYVTWIVVGLACLGGALAFAIR